jgi:protein gp37
MGDTSIEWTDKTWNPVTGCTKVSQGCKHCYAEAIANRMWATQYKPNADGTARKFTDVRCHDDRLTQPLSWKKPARVFVNSMSDLFHPDVPFEFILRVFGVMREAHWHTFQVLTKRPEIAFHFMSWLMNGLGYTSYPTPNVWLGVSVEDQANADKRIPVLLQTPAAVRFISAEPLLGPVKLQGWDGQLSRNYLGSGYVPDVAHRAPLNWVIVGGESGRGARPFNPDWARSIRDQCAAAGVAFFMKQMGGLRPGTTLEALPPDLRVREFPERVAA